MARLLRKIRSPARSRERVSVQQADRVAKRMDRVLAQRIEAALRAESSPATIARLAQQVTGELQGLLTREAERSYTAWRRLTAQAAKTNSDAATPSQLDLTRAANRPHAGQTWRTRLRDHGPTEAQVRRAMRGADSPASRRQAVRDLFRQPRARIKALARTETQRVDNIMRERAMQDVVGERIVGWRYTTQGDNRVRPEHRRLDGRVYSLSERRPPMPNGPGCRCYWLPVVAPKA